MTAPKFADSIVPQGPVDGINRTFLLPDAPNPPDSLHLYLAPLGGDGRRQMPGQYELEIRKITMKLAPHCGARLLADYRS